MRHLYIICSLFIIIIFYVHFMADMLINKIFMYDMFLCKKNNCFYTNILVSIWARPKMLCCDSSIILLLSNASLNFISKNLKFSLGKRRWWVGIRRDRPRAGRRRSGLQHRRWHRQPPHWRWHCYLHHQADTWRSGCHRRPPQSERFHSPG